MNDSFYLPQDSPKISRLKSEGINKRDKLLSKMPEEFTSRQLADVNGLTKDAANVQVKKMLRWNQVVEKSTYKTPRVYRKVDA